MGKHLQNNKERFRSLHLKYLENELNEQEYLEYCSLLEKIDINEDVLQEDKDWSESKKILKSIQSLEEKQKWKIKFFKYTAGIAASFLLIVSVWIFNNYDEDNQTSFVLHETSFGETKTIALADGSEVILNANSIFLWDEHWEKTGKRYAKVTGEAFFDVRHLDNDMEFVVEAEGLLVNVLGTSFNVSDRGDLVEVYLEEGKIALEVESNEKKETVLMLPGNKVKVEKATSEYVKEEQQTIATSASWVEGMLRYENKNLKEILASLESLYGKSFTIENELLLEKRMDLTVPYSDWQLLKKALEISLRVEFIEKENSIVIR